MTTWIKEATDTTISSTVTGQITADSLDVDNINIDGNTISSTDTNGNIIIAPDGSGIATFTGDVQCGGTFKASTGASGITTTKTIITDDEVHYVIIIDGLITAWDISDI